MSDIWYEDKLMQNRRTYYELTLNLKDSDVRKARSDINKVAIVYCVDYGRLEVIAVCTYHQMLNPSQHK